jgi:hypothetical protein
MTDTTKPGDPADKAADGAFGGVTSHRAGYGDKLARVEDWVRRWPSATLASGEGAVLLQEIDRLNKAVSTLLSKNDDLRAAIAQVRALHKRYINIDGTARCWSDGMQHPCPTLRALDGEGA